MRDLIDTGTFISSIVVPFIVVWLSIHISHEDKKKSDNRKRQNESLKQIEIRLLRIEILDMLFHQRQDVNLISEKYDEYLKMGGNSYLKELIEKWRSGKPYDDYETYNFPKRRK